MASDSLAAGTTRVGGDEVRGCGILFHQRPMLQDIVDLTHPLNLLFLSSWLGTPADGFDDADLRDATIEVDGHNLLFLKALVDGRPELINIELPAGEWLTVGQLVAADRTICVHETDDPASGFYLRHAEYVRILGPIRGWRLRGRAERDSASEMGAPPSEP